MDHQRYPPAPMGYPPVANQATYPPPMTNPGSSYGMAQPSGYPPFNGDTGSSYQVAGPPPHHQAQPSCPPVPPHQVMNSKAVAVISPHYCAPCPVDLTIVRKLLKLTEDNFSVKDVNGNLIFQIKDKLTLLRERRVLLDAAGNPIVTIQEKIRTVHRRFQVFRGDSKDPKDLLYSAKQSSFIQFKTKLDVFLANNTTEDVCDYKVKGSLLERSCVIYAGESDNILAQMQKKLTVEGVVLGKDKFTVTVSPNIDYAFIVSLIVVLDAVNDSRHAT